MEEALSCIGRMPIFNGIEEEELYTLIKCCDGQMAMFENDQWIFQAGEELGYIMVVLKGRSFAGGVSWPAESNSFFPAGKGNPLFCFCRALYEATADFSGAAAEYRQKSLVSRFCFVGRIGNFQFTDRLAADWARSGGYFRRRVPRDAGAGHSAFISLRKRNAPALPERFQLRGNGEKAQMS